ncbi:MAG TPA: hypothetical protein PLN52_01840, partial [Opitutaceae bacterium]|nr:hypothetical protein [Opitutaceae bacterium]
RLHRACPNYLQMMDELLADCSAKGYRRIGLVMSYGDGGIGHKLFTSSFLFYQSKISPSQRIPILPKPSIAPATMSEWFQAHHPDVVISAGSVAALLTNIGLRIPEDVAFANIDISEPPDGSAGADHRYNLVGGEVVKLVLGQLDLNLTGIPENPKVVLVDSHRREGYTLPPKKDATPATRHSRPRSKLKPAAPLFRGFLD